MTSGEFITYDISGLEPIERVMLKELLTADGVEFRGNDVMLVVPIEAEAIADGRVAYVERYAAVLADVSENAQRVREGDTSAARCEACGSSPAAPIRLRRQTGMIVVRTMHSLEAVLCDACAAAATKRFQTETAVKGWTGVVSALSNPVVIASNANNRRKHKKNLNS